LFRGPPISIIYYAVFEGAAIFSTWGIKYMTVRSLLLYPIATTLCCKAVSVSYANPASYTTYGRYGARYYARYGYAAADQLHSHSQQPDHIRTRSEADLHRRLVELDSLAPGPWSYPRCSNSLGIQQPVYYTKHYIN
jgi:hypothetical protein